MVKRMTDMAKALKIEERDNVAVMLEPVRMGERCKVSKTIQLTVSRDIPFGHKVALTDISEGEPVIKYGEVIGYATRSIHAGDWVHTHNILSQRGRLTTRGDA
jgi:altronate dehydratase